MIAVKGREILHHYRDSPSLALARFSDVTFASLANLISKPVRIEISYAR
jgi:hypothetical protein